MWKAALKTKFEQDRLKELRGLNLFDVENDPDFNNVIRLVKETFSVPVVLVSIVEEDEQIFKACIGVDVDKTDRDSSFCSFAIHQNDVFIVNDTFKDANFKHNRLVTGEPKIRFYAGYPLFFEEKEAIGTLCIIDTKPRKKFNDADIKKLSDFGEIIKSLIRLKQKKLSLEDSNNVKNKFLSHVAHEIRTPTGAISGLTKILQGQVFDPKLKNLVNTIATASNSLLDLVNTVLDLGTMENKNFKLSQERFSFTQLFDEIISITKVKASEKNLSLNLKISILEGRYYEGDKTRLKQIFVNLINNAIKFTDTGAILVVANYKLNPNDNCKNEIEFQVIDTGIGISKDNLDQIFEKYYQANSNGSYYEGTGLGLSITKELVEKMDGSIRVESSPGFGSKFFVSIPDKSLSKPHSIRDDLGDNSKTDRSFRILVAEDYEPNAFLIENILFDYGLDCVVVENGQKAIDMLKADQFDAVLMDINMPVLGGIEATKTIKQDKKLSKIPIIGLSAHVSKEGKQECLSAGMDDYISKPINTSELYAKINAILNIE